MLGARDFSCADSGFWNLYWHSCLRPAGQRIPSPARKKPLAPRVTETKLYLAHSTHSGGVKVTKYCIRHIAFICIMKRFKLFKPGTLCYNLSTRDSAEKKKKKRRKHKQNKASRGWENDAAVFNKGERNLLYNHANGKQPNPLARVPQLFARQNVFLLVFYYNI